MSEITTRTPGAPSSSSGSALTTDLGLRRPRKNMITCLCVVVHGLALFAGWLEGLLRPDVQELYLVPLAPRMVPVNHPTMEERFALRVGNRSGVVFVDPSGRARRDHNLVTDAARDRLVLFGGFSHEFLADTWSLSPRRR